LNMRRLTLFLFAIAMMGTRDGRAQSADSRPARPLQLTVRVRDTANVGVVGADVSIVLGLNESHGTATTDQRGLATLTVGEANRSADYQLVVRKIGYERSDRFFRLTSDSLSLDVILRRVTQELAPVVVTAEQDIKRKAYHVGADDIAASKEVLIDATDILAKMRPDMICGRSCRPMAGIAATTRTAARKCPGLALSQPTTCPADDSPPSVSTNVWVNGRRIRLAALEEMAIARQHGMLAGLSQASMSVLSEIKPEHIAEITYLDEFDTTVDKIGAQAALFVVLKPGIGFEPGRESYVIPTEPAPKTNATSAMPSYRFRVLGVFDSDSGDPIEGAFVIDMTTGLRARTTSTGTVSLSFLPEGGSPVRISREGYDDLEVAVEISNELLTPITLVMAKRQKPPQ
jgi:hypothetical protein